MNFSKSNHARNAFTLVEVLIVIAIMSVIAALVIPRVRTVNKDRNIRETARTIGAMFNSASNLARIEGGGGVLLVKNPNFVAPGGVEFAVTTMYRLRYVDPYTGLNPGDGFTLRYDTVNAVWFFDIEQPLQEGLVRAGDSCSFGAFNVSVINTVTNGGTLTLELEVLDENCNPLAEGDPGAPTVTDTSLPPFSDPRPWIIHRRPRIVESSKIDFSDGYYIDMRYSDYLPANQFQPGSRLIGNQFDKVSGTWNVIPEFNESISVIFNSEGGIDYIDTVGANNKSKPFSPLFLFVAEYDVNQSRDPLSQESHLWVQVNHVYGGVNVGYNAPNFTNVPTYAQSVVSARQIASSTAQD